MKSFEKALLKIWRDLPESAQLQLMDFAEFLLQKNKNAREPIPSPVITPAKENESVVGALKRLSASYPMLDKAKLLNDTSVLVSQHVVQGRDKIEVIQELEMVFQRHYQRLIEDNSGND